IKGASTEPCANTNSAPTISITRTTGSSHHFLRKRMNAQSSRATLASLIPHPRSYCAQLGLLAAKRIGPGPRKRAVATSVARSGLGAPAKAAPLQEKQESGSPGGREDSQSEAAAAATPAAPRKMPS